MKNRKLTISLLLTALILMISAGSTLAYLNTGTVEKTNVFTPADNIRARLTEPNWNAEEGMKLVPGKTLDKDPMITNSGDIDEYTAIRLTFQYKDGTKMKDADLIKLLNVTKISWNAKWVLHDGSITKDNSGKVTAVNQPLIYYYNESLAQGEVSDPIFNGITVKNKSDGLLEMELRWLQGIKIEDGKIITDPGGLKGFKIKVEGAAIQKQGYPNASAAADSLKALFP